MTKRRKRLGALFAAIAAIGTIVPLALADTPETKLVSMAARHIGGFALFGFVVIMLGSCETPAYQPGQQRSSRSGRSVRSKSASA
jgi:hypothetical protein